MVSGKRPIHHSSAPEELRLVTAMYISNVSVIGTGAFVANRDYEIDSFRPVFVDCAEAELLARQLPSCCTTFAGENKPWRYSGNPGR